MSELRSFMEVANKINALRCYGSDGDEWDSYGESCRRQNARWKADFIEHYSKNRDKLLNGRWLDIIQNIEKRLCELQNRYESLNDEEEKAYEYIKCHKEAINFMVTTRGAK